MVFVCIRICEALGIRVYTYPARGECSSADSSVESVEKAFAFVRESIAECDSADFSVDKVHAHCSMRVILSAAVQTSLLTRLKRVHESVLLLARVPS